MRMVSGTRNGGEQLFPVSHREEFLLTVSVAASIWEKVALFPTNIPNSIHPSRNGWTVHPCTISRERHTKADTRLMYDDDDDWTFDTPARCYRGLF